MKRLFVLIMAVCLLGMTGISEARYIDNGDGTVSDTWTSLMWQHATVPYLLNWDEAIAYCDNMVFAGYSDWRLPNIDELRSLADNSYRPTIHPDFFPDTRSDTYWSSTTASYISLALAVDFNYSFFGQDVSLYKTSSTYVRAVRGGRTVNGSFGSLTIEIYPAEARNSGAQWRRTSTNTWYNSGQTETDIPAGSYSVEFKEVRGWAKPASINVIINPGQTHSATAAYTAMGINLNPDFSFVVPKMIYNPDTETYMELEVGFKFVGEQNGKFMWELDHIK